MALGVQEIVRRLGYHPPTSNTIHVFEDIRHRFIELALHLDESLPDGREKSEALTCLQTSLQYAIGSVACNTGPGEDPLPHAMPPGYGERGGLPSGAPIG